MSVFLFLKQIVDVMYPYHWLDYMMVIMVVIALIYQILLVRPSVKKSITLVDIFIILLGILLTLSFLRSLNAYGVYVKVLSAFLMYFVGRIYYDRIKECTGALVTAAYWVVYINLFYRLYRVGISGIFKVANAGGDLYYYDTDMAFAMILAMCFIGMYGRNMMRKYITLFFVCPYMVFFSDADIQKGLLFIVFFIMMLYLVEQVSGKRNMANGILAVTIIGFICFLVILMLPVFVRDGNIGADTFVKESFLNNENMCVRYEKWREIKREIENADITSIILGINLSCPAGSMYVKMLYSVGMAGILLFISFLAGAAYYLMQMKDRKTFYMVVLLAFMLLGTGATVDSMEATQMSWFPMMFAGMVISSAQNGREAW